MCSVLSACCQGCHKKRPLRMLIKWFLFLQTDIDSMSPTHAKCVIFFPCWWRYSWKILSTYFFFLFELCTEWWQVFLLKWFHLFFPNACFSFFFIALFFMLLLYCALLIALIIVPAHIAVWLCLTMLPAAKQDSRLPTVAKHVSLNVVVFPPGGNVCTVIHK